MKAFIGFQDDIFNLSASLAKIGFLHAHRATIQHGMERMVITKIEYILSVCRSILPALGLVVYHMLNACEKFLYTLEAVIRFPKPLVPGMRFFMRGYFNDEFVVILRDAAQRAVASQNS